MKIRTDYWPKPIPDRRFDWSAIDDDTYDGEGCPIGYGRTEQEAIDNLMAEIADRHLWRPMKESIPRPPGIFVAP